jgi:hypothetical protein
LDLDRPAALLMGFGGGLEDLDDLETGLFGEVANQVGTQQP